MRLKCGQCGVIHTVSERNVPDNGVKMVRCDACDNHFVINSDSSVTAKYDTCRRICPNCGKESLLEAMQCRYCELFFGKEDQLKNKRLIRHGQNKPSTTRRRSTFLFILGLIICAMVLGGYLITGKGDGKLGRFVRDIVVFPSENGATSSYYRVKLVSGGQLDATSYERKGELVIIEEQNGTMITIGEQQILEIVPMP